MGSVAASSGTDAVEVVRTEAGVLALRDRLAPLSWGRYDADPEVFLAVVRMREEAIRPHVVVLPGEHPAALLARLEQTALPIGFGYKVVLRPTVRALVTIPGGAPGADDATVAAKLAAPLGAALTAGEADVLMAFRLPETSPVLAAAQMLGSGIRSVLGRPLQHWSAAIPDDFADFLAARSKKTRYHARRIARQLQTELGDRVCVRRYARTEDLERVLHDLGTVAPKTYQWGLGVGFSGAPLDVELIRLGLARGTYRAHVLYVDDAPIAFWSGHASRGTFFIDTPGYDPAFSSLEVGTFLLLDLIDGLCADPDIHRLDHGHGYAVYKERFGDECRIDRDLLVFAPSFRATALALEVKAFARLETAACRALGEHGVARVKSLWRRRLSSGTPAVRGATWSR